MSLVVSIDIQYLYHVSLLNFFVFQNFHDMAPKPFSPQFFCKVLKFADELQFFIFPYSLTDPTALWSNFYQNNRPLYGPTYT